MHKTDLEEDARRARWVYLGVTAACFIGVALCGSIFIALAGIATAYASSYFAAEEQVHKNNRIELQRAHMRLAQRAKGRS